MRLRMSRCRGTCTWKFISKLLSVTWTCSMSTKSVVGVFKKWEPLINQVSCLKATLNLRCVPPVHASEQAIRTGNDGYSDSGAWDVFRCTGCKQTSALYQVGIVSLRHMWEPFSVFRPGKESRVKAELGNTKENSISGCIWLYVV